MPCRERAIALLAAASGAARALLARLGERGAHVASAGLQAALLAAHAASVVAPEALAALAGRLPGPGTAPLLQVGKPLALAEKICMRVFLVHGAAQLVQRANTLEHSMFVLQLIVLVCLIGVRVM